MKYLKFVFILFVISFVSCSSDDPVAVRKAAVKNLYKHGTVKIAIANSFAHNQTKMWEAAVLAQEKINSEKLMPAKLELFRADDGGTPISGMKKAYEIAFNDDYCAVIGHGYSDISLPCSLIYQYYGLLTFNYISTAHEITERENPFLFSNMPDDNDYGDAIAELCDKNNYKNLLIYYLENTSGTSISNAVELSCNNYGINIVNRESFDLTSTTKSIDRSVKRWKNNFMFDAVFIAGRMPILQDIISIMRENGLDCPIVGADPFDDPLLTQNLTEAENGRIFAFSNYSKESKNPNFNEFYYAFKAKYNVEPDQEALQVYDALFVLAEAISIADSAVPADLAAILHKKLWNEAAGPYTFDSAGAIRGRRLTAKVFKDGEFVEFEPEKLN